jgi:NTE family protein
MNLGLALSGGGFRATVYHLGVLARLAHEDRLEDVTFLSTVSGGSLCVGLVYALSQFRWPSSQAYRETVLPQARRQMTTQDFQAELLRWALRAPWRFFQTKASGVSRQLQQQWGVSIRLNELPSHPRWMINATCYETGKNWRFERFRMGDYLFGYTNDTDIPLSHALAASAGFPGLIGPLVLSTNRQRWFKYNAHSQESDTEAGEPDDSHLTETVKPAFSSVHLWDGGVYDNHGLEGVHDFTTGWRQGIDFLVISDGSGKAKVESYRLGAGVFLRIITGVMMDQIRSLRSRAVLERIRNHDDKGVYLTIGRDCPSVIAAAGKSQELAPLYRDSLMSEEADRAGDFPTVIRKLTDAEFELLFRHGFEIADCTLHAYYPDLFGHIAYQPSG